jgi:hypothetical protein
MLADPAAADALIELYRNTEINTLVLDIKATTGRLAYPSSLAVARQSGASAADDAMLANLRRLQAHNVPLVARLSCFKDDLTPRRIHALAVRHTGTGGVNWLDFQMHAWLNPGAEGAQQYLYDVITEVAGLGITDFWLDYVNFPVHGHQDRIRYEFDRPRQEILAGFLEGARSLVHGFGGSMWASADLSLFLPEGEEASAFYSIGGQSAIRFARSADRLVADLRYHAANFADVSAALMARHGNALPFLPFIAYSPLEGRAFDAALLDVALDYISGGRAWGYVVLSDEYPAGAFNLKVG